MAVVRIGEGNFSDLRADNILEPFRNEAITDSPVCTVSNAQENYYDVVSHLYYNEIRATSMFADRESQ
jgi:hypothetical protein